MSLIWFAVNNRATLEDLSDLKALGIEMTGRSAVPVHVYRDPDSEMVVAEIGAVTAWKDGRVTFRPRCDTPDGAVNVLVRTALDYLERDLHRRDRWDYRRATKARGGYWYAHVMVQVPEGTSLEALAAALRPARRDDRPVAERAVDPQHPLSAEAQA